MTGERIGVQQECSDPLGLNPLFEIALLLCNRGGSDIGSDGEDINEVADLRSFPNRKFVSQQPRAHISPHTRWPHIQARSVAKQIQPLRFESHSR